MKFYAALNDAHRTRIAKKLLLIMKLTTVLLITVIMQVSASGFAQKINLKLNNATLYQVFKKIKAQSGYSFLYNIQMLKQANLVDIDVTNAPLTEALEACFAGQPVAYTINEKTVIVRKRLAVSPQAQKLITVTGRVTDGKGLALQGVNIQVPNSKIGTTTNDNGIYKISVEDNVSLTFSYIGFTTQTIAVNGRDKIDVVLQDADPALTEVVVVGYGTQKKVSVTGAISSISSAEVKQAPTSNLSNSLAGLLPGLTVVNGGGRPGSGSTISVRGKSTFGDSGALIVVDGIVRGFDQLDPNEVESITVLKDAAAAAVYGARAANGVILVTTKRGHIGKPKFSYNGYVGTQQPTTYPKLMNAYEYATANNAARLNNGANPVGNPLFYTDQQLQDFKNGSVGTDWYAISFKKNPVQMQHNINVDGGSENIKYFFSGGYTNQDGMYNNINFKRYNFRSNVDARINQNLTMSVDIDAQNTVNNSPSFTDVNIFAHVIRQNPVFNAFYPDGLPKNTTGEHPVLDINNSGYIHDNNNSLSGTIGFKQDMPFVTKGLSLTGRFNYIKGYKFLKEFDLPYTMYDEDATGKIIGTKVVGKNLTKTELNESFEQPVSSTINLSLNYQRSFAKHDISALFLYEQASGNMDKFNAYRTDFPSNEIDQLFAGGDTNKDNNGTATQTGRKSFVGRVNYAYAGKYLFEASFRYDGSTIFPPGKRYGFFPAVSTGWRISEEGFIKDNPALSFINNLKLRASYGILGNDRVDPYQYTDQFSTQGSPIAIFNNSDIERTLIYGVYPNPNITWERAKTVDVGLEGTLFNGKLGFEFDYFYKRTSDILQPRILSIPGTFGRKMPSENYAVADNKGYEITLSHSSRINQVNLSVKANMAYAKNIGIVLDDAAGDPLYKRRVGKGLDYRYGLTSAGIFQSDQEVKNSPFQTNTTAAGDIKYVDKNGDGVIDDSDIDVISNDGAIPKFTFGLFLSADWKGFDLAALFQGAAKSDFFMTGTARNMFNNGGNSNSFAYLNDYWSPQNPGAEYPRAWIDANPNNNKDSDFWLRKTGYVRLKSIQFGYTIPGIKKWKIEKLRFYFAAYNLFTISQFKLFDPEVDAKGAVSPGSAALASATVTPTTNSAGNYYPQQKNYNIGVNLTF
ncbi:TonB-linked outer membrane protein, SusC/RagA family [Pedobacter sp. ok626]|nr:TonB-linked outer membrane protein, SusC/RagA family [Pedobacter sp. ok626]